MFKRNPSILEWLTGISLALSIALNFGSQLIQFARLKADTEAIKISIEELRKTQYPRQEAQSVFQARDRVWELQVNTINNRITDIEKRTYYITKP